MNVEFYWVAFAVVTIMSSARLTRLATWDHFPPVKAMREKFAEWTDTTDRRRGWQILAYCGYCFSFWATLVVVLWADAAGVLDGETVWGSSGDTAQPIWWIVNGVLGGSYLAAIVMANDGDDGEAA